MSEDNNSENDNATAHTLCDCDSGPPHPIPHIKDMKLTTATVNIANCCGAPPLFASVCVDTYREFETPDARLNYVKWLISLGADVNVVTKNRCTALIAAAYGGHPQSLDLFFQAGANVEWSADDGCTALMYATTNGCSENVDLLLKYHANVNAVAKSGDGLMGVLYN